MREIIATGKTVEEATENGCRELGLSRSDVSVEILEMPVRKLFKTLPAKVKVTAEGGEEETPAAAAVEEKTPEKVAEKPAVKPVEKEEKIAEKPVAAAQAATEKPQQPAKGSKRAVLPEEPVEEIDLAVNAPAKMAVDYLSDIFAALGATGVQITAYKQGDATLLRVEGEELADLIETRGDTIQALSYLTDRSVNKGVDKKDDNYLRIRLDIAGYRNRRENELTSLATRTGKEVQRTHRSKTLAPMNPYERLIVHTTISGMEGLVSESIGADAERRVVIKSTAEDATEGEDWRAPRKGGPRGGNNRGRGGQGGQGGRGGNNNRGGRPGQGGNRDRGPRRDNNGPRRDSRTSTPEREYADRPRDPGAKPVVPDQREAISDGQDLPLYGKIEL